MPYTQWDDICRRYPGAFEKTTWDEDFQYRISTGGCDRAATLYANGRHPEEQRELPSWDDKTGKPPPRPDGAGESVRR